MFWAWRCNYSDGSNYITDKLFHTYWPLSSEISPYLSARIYASSGFKLEDSHRHTREATGNSHSPISNRHLEKWRISPDLITRDIVAVWILSSNRRTDTLHRCSQFVVTILQNNWFIRLLWYFSTTLCRQIVNNAWNSQKPPLLINECNFKRSRFHLIWL